MVLSSRIRANQRAVASYIGAGIITPGGGGGGAPTAPAIYGLMSKTADGSVGQTYSGPAWSSPQWYRETLASPKTRTAIVGATGRTYVATIDDVGFRVVMAGMDAGVLKVAAPYAAVLPAPIILESFDTAANLLTSAAGNPAFTVDAADKLQGSASVIALSQGATSRVMRNLGPLPGLAGVGNLAGLGSLAWLKEELEPYAMARTSADIRLDQTTGTPGASGAMLGAVALNSHKGKVWNSVRPEQNAYLQGRAQGASDNWKGSFDRTAASGSPHVQRTRYDAFVAKGGGRPCAVLGCDDGINIDEAITEARVRDMLMTHYVPSKKVTDATSSSIYRWVDYRRLASYGMDIQCDGTPDDSSMVNGKSNPAESIGLLKTCRNTIMAEIPGTDPRHFCYPNGDTDVFVANQPNAIIDHRLYAGGAAVGTTGSAVITGMTSTSGLAAGMPVGGFGIPAGTKIASVDSSTQITLTTALTAALTTIAVWDDSHPFFLDQLQDALRADGTFYTGRTTNFDTFHSRFGIAGRDFLMPAFSMSNGTVGNDTPEQMADRAVSRLDAAIARRENIEFYFHGIKSSGITFIDTPMSTFVAFLNALQARRDAGLVDVLTKAQWWARDGGSSFPN